METASNNNSKEFCCKGEQTNRTIDKRGDEEGAFVREKKLQQSNPVEGGNDVGSERRETCWSRSEQMGFSAGEEGPSLQRSLASSAVVKGSNTAEMCCL